METSWFLSCPYYLTFDQPAIKLGGGRSLMTKGLLEYLIELGKTACFLDCLFIVKGHNAGPGRWRDTKGSGSPPAPAAPTFSSIKTFRALFPIL